MENKPLAAIKNFLLTIGLLVVIALIGLLAKEAWRIYGEGKKAQRVTASGTRMLVRLDEVSTAKRNWRDYLSNSKYVTFHFQGKDNTLRYSQDSVFLQPGISVPVLYDAATGEFIQPGTELKTKQAFYKTSPLVHWNVLAFFSGPNVALCCFIGLAAIFLVLTTNLLARLTGMALIQKVGDLTVFIFFICGALYLSYDTFSYWRYYAHLRHQGVPETVRVEKIEKEAEFNATRENDIPFYLYPARVNYQGESRIIAAAGTDYDQLKPGDNLSVLYDRNKDDMMSVNYSMQYHAVVFTVLIWIILLFIFSRRLRNWTGNRG